MTCQTAETMFANKLVAPLDRFEKYKTIAGRDIYDIHYFAKNNWDINAEVLLAMTGKKSRDYLVNCVAFIEKIRDMSVRQSPCWWIVWKKDFV